MSLIYNMFPRKHLLHSVRAISDINLVVSTLQCAENKELQEKVDILEQRLDSLTVEKSLVSSEQSTSEEYADELKKKVQSQVKWNFQSFTLY